VFSAIFDSLPAFFHSIKAPLHGTWRGDGVRKKIPLQIYLIDVSPLRGLNFSTDILLLHFTTPWFVIFMI